MFGSGGALPTYGSAANAFSVSFDVWSTPAVTALGGTVFAAVPSYYSRGFGTPVDPDALNVAKAGRAIPLKWQVFDFVVEPVTDLDPAVVTISSVAIPCDGGGSPSDSVEEYATGGSAFRTSATASTSSTGGLPRATAGRVAACGSTSAGANLGGRASAWWDVILGPSAAPWPSRS